MMLLRPRFSRVMGIDDWVKQSVKTQTGAVVEIIQEICVICMKQPSPYFTSTHLFSLAERKMASSTLALALASSSVTGTSESSTTALVNASA